MWVPERRVVVFAMGKTGTTTVQRAIERVAPPGWDVHRVHHLAPARVAEARRRYELEATEPPHVSSARLLQMAPPSRAVPWDVVTLPREPVARSVAHFFQVGEREGWFGPADFGVPPEPGLLALLVHRFVHDFDHRQAATWFAEELGGVLGVDMFALPYDRASGLMVNVGDHLRLLALRTEDLDRIGASALGRFLGCGVDVGRENHGPDKPYAPLYRAFVDHARLPAALVDAMYCTRDVRHFYRPEEVRCLRARWTEGQ